MAPSLPIYSRDEIKSLYPELFPERIPTENGPKLDLDDCTLHSITQNQCTFDGNNIICVPFKRIFARCLDKQYAKRREVIGYKLTPSHKEFSKDPNAKVYRNVELTDWFDNDYSSFLKDKSKKEGIVDANLLREFARADKVMKKKIQEYYENLLKEQKRDS